MLPDFKTGKFPLGRVVITTAAVDALTAADVKRGLFWHSQGNWGDVSPDDAAENDLSLREGFRLLSAYTAENGTPFWVITEADRSATTVLLPDDY